MKNLCGIAIVIAALAACKKEKAASGDGAPERDGSELWKLAPEGTSAGVVIAKGAGSELHRGFIAVATSLKSNPLGAKAVEKMLAEPLQEGVDLMSPDGFKSIGIDPSLPLAIFWVGQDVYGIVPVSDRAAFNKQVKGTEKDGIDIVEGESACKMEGSYYRCAKSVEKLAAWKPAAKAVDEGWPTELRGSVEFFVGPELLGGAEPIEKTMDSVKGIRGAVRIERGAALLRFAIDGKVKQKLATGDTPLADAARKSNPAALLTGYGRALIDLARTEAGAKLDEPGPGGVTGRKLLDALTGELVAFAPAGGEPRGFVEIGIRDPAPFKAMTALCAMAPPLGEGITIKSTNNGCSASFGPPAVPMPVAVAVEVTDNAIVATLGDAAAGREGKGPALPKYYTEKSWLGSLWLRGSILAGADALPAPELKQMLQQEPEMSLGLWGYAHLSELGAGLRTDDGGAHGFVRVATTWRNPPEVVDKLEPLIARFAQGDLAVSAEVKKLAEAHPESPLAADMQLGSSGGAAGAAGVGVMAAVAVPAFLKYKQKAADAGGKQFLLQLETLERQMCQCADKACAERLNQEFQRWTTQPPPALSPDESDRFRQVVESYSKCMMKAMTAR